MTTITFEGSVQRGQRFEKELGNHFIFRVGPKDELQSEEFWEISVVHQGPTREEDRTIYRQFPHGESPLDIWIACAPGSAAKCRNSLLKGNGLGGRERRFQIGIGRILPLSIEEKVQADQRPDPLNTMAKYEMIGSGLFRIEEVSLEKAQTNGEGKRSQYWISAITFKVEIKMPVLKEAAHA